MTDLVKRENTELANQGELIYGFEETKDEDLIFARVKVINALSPERVDGLAEEGDVINNLTMETVAGKRFIPLKQYYSNIYWNPDRNAEDRFFCRSMDGRIGQDENGSLVCAQCKKNQWDNTKSGKEAQPKCTAYLNFMGFFADDMMPYCSKLCKNKLY